MRKIKDIPTVDRPREKLQDRGVKALSDFELLQILIGSGVSTASVGSIAKDLKKLIDQKSTEITMEDLLEINGISTAKASIILSSFELAKRHYIEDEVQIETLDDILDQLQDIKDKKQEYFVCLALDGGNRLLENRIITIGTLNASLVHPREVFADVISDRAASVIVAHNHPSGSVEPSKEDIEVTKRLANAGRILGVSLKDHIIITSNEHFSFRRKGLI